MHRDQKHKHKERMKNDHSYKSKKGPSTEQSKVTADEAIQKRPVVASSNDVLLIGDEEESKRQFSKREVTNNWDKYKEDLRTEDNEQLSAADFENLLIAPASVGSHFVFSTEKTWGEQTTEIQSTQYFQLNLAELAVNIESIPFYERQGYSANLFNENELHDMMAKAKLSEKLVLSQKKDRMVAVQPKSIKHDVVSNAVPENVVPPKTTPILQQQVKEVKNHTLKETVNSKSDDELDELLGMGMKTVTLDLKDVSDQENRIKVMPAVVVAPVHHASVANSKTTDLQQWLDDIFDD